MFDKHLFIRMSEDHSVQAANILAMSHKAHDETLKVISEKEIKSKDRVDISLEEYENLKNELSDLHRENCALKLTLRSIGLPAEIIDRIIPQSVRVERCDDYRDFKMHYRINFSVDDSPDIRKRRMI